MKKLLCLAVMAVCLTSCMYDLDSTPSYDIQEGSQNIVIFLHSPTCGYSLSAKKYIENNYPNAKIWYVDIDQRDNSSFLKSAVHYYNLDKNDLSTPIICLGENCIEGWDYYKRQELDVYIQRYLK